MKKVGILFLIFVFASVGIVSAETGMRCGNLFVEEGTQDLQIMANCGEPKFKEKYYLDRYGDVDKWVYGPDAGYFNVIYLFGGAVVKVESIRQD
jgi:hypothetical protein